MGLKLVACGVVQLKNTQHIRLKKD